MPGRSGWPSRDPLGDWAFYQAQIKGKTWKYQSLLREESKYPSYLFIKNDPESKIDSLGTYTYSWAPSPCQGSNIKDGFIQVHLGGGLLSQSRLVDDGTHGLKSTKPNCPPLYPASEDNRFNDSPGVSLGLFGFPIGTHGLNGTKVEVCHVCLIPCCGVSFINGINGVNSSYPYSGYKIVKIGPCMSYTISEGEGQLFLNTHGVATSSVGPSADFSQTVNSAYPKALSGGCIDCKSPN